jgi:hypothetical protein
VTETEINEAEFERWKKEMLAHMYELGKHNSKLWMEIFIKHLKLEDK